MEQAKVQMLARAVVRSRLRDVRRNRARMIREGTLGRQCTLSLQQRKFASEYVLHMDAKRAANRAGTHASCMFSNPEVMKEVDEQLTKLEEKTGLDAEYVRQYIKDVLELCPTDYFFLAPDGQWMVDPEQFRALPENVKRLVEGVEVRLAYGRPLFSVKFLSKSAALAMAAKYTLTQKIQGKLTVGLPWDKIADKLEGAAEDSIERRIEGLNGATNGVKGSV